MRASEYLLSAGVILRVQLTLYHDSFPYNCFTYFFWTTDI